MPMNINDPRVVRTKTNLRRALVDLMKHEDLSSISVQKITDIAGITRGTFYLHFKDKADFMEKTTQSILDEFFDDTIYKTVVDGQQCEVLNLERAFRYIESDAEVWEVFLDSEKHVTFYDEFYGRVAEYLTNYFNAVNIDHRKPKVPLPLQISFNASAFLGVIQRWLDDDMIYTSRYMNKSVEQLFGNLNVNDISVSNFFLPHEPIADDGVGEE
ncbi:MAG: TetR/AcrR family transcriptional regulator [Limosilactobacillus sp.]|uniref:TetR/AcrR family transcriptional regulator n=1 Tax=Limosilactobacillus sp. TaxID=2773925 RepID=UPI0026F9D121|nr:TetR/AcrR family transcriptional regulator [Limosilactobacillus sp.]